MRYVERPKRPPAVLAPSSTKGDRERLAQQVERGERLSFNSKRWAGSRDDLRALFSFKCAFCEQGVDPGMGGEEHFRPLESAVDLRGKTAMGYWWLAYEWKNLYLMCVECNRSKRNRFPVTGRRAEPFADLENERPLLLDPCNIDDFAETHLVYSRGHPGDPDAQQSAGLVAPRTQRGQVTIDVLSLNRSSLRESRKSVTRYLYDEFGDYRGELAPPDMLAGWTAPDQEHSGMVMQILRGWFPKQIEDVLWKRQPYTPGEIMADFDVERYIERHLKRTAKAQTVDVEAETVQDRAVLFRTLRRIEHIKIKNFRAIEDLELDFPDPRPDPTADDGSAEREAWLALLGENGVGKSSVLQAIALALMGDEQRQELREYRARPENVLTHGKSAGFVEVAVSGLDEAVRLQFDQDAYWSNYIRSPMVLLGYGSTRLLRTADQSATSDKTGLVNLDNLFNPFARLNDVERWVADTSQVSSDRFKDIADALMDLLQLDRAKARIFRLKGYVRIDHGDRTEWLGELSDGYAAVVALALDVMMVLSSLWTGEGSIRNAEGVVLLDEIGVHLHPRWQMEIVSRLRLVFPNIQFITTTHQPLCLQGLTEGEAVYMGRDETDKIFVLDDLPSPSDLRAEQLLTSPFFGLHTTVSPDVDRAFTEYYTLLGKSNLKAAERRRLEKLKDELKGRRLLGDSPREELMYEVIDKLLVQDDPKTVTERMPQLKKQAVANVREMWESHLAAMEERLS